MWTYKCSLCTDTFETKKEFDMHMKEHINKVDKYESGLGGSDRKHLMDLVNN